MNEYEMLNHIKWECKCHVVFIPKYWREVLYHELRKHVGTLFHTLAEQKESRIMMISIPPKYAVSQVIGYIKGKSAAHIARTFLEKHRNFVGQNFWARGYFVSTVGRDEAVVRQYIRGQEEEDRRLDQLRLF